ncbi:MAG: bifunctional aldolase/short-chain dehydrogenase [Pelolinea sp.]|nr:bifunctional aldolase/short-chain dehydrogenase [Pelolinea sp.]
MPENLWSMNSLKKLPGLDGLVYRCNLLGADCSIVNVFGGNNSVKQIEKDHLGRDVEVLWVKGSGSNLATITEQGFSGLKLADILPLLEREQLSDEEMVEYLSHCCFLPDRPRQSIEALLHAFLPFKHIDHTHPDAVISMACTPNGKDVCEELWGEEVVWVDYIRPGFTLSKWIAEGVKANPKARLVVMARHGLVTWGETSQDCYENTLRAINEAEEFIRSRKNQKPVSEIANFSILSKHEREDVLASVLPLLRGALSAETPKIIVVDNSEEVLTFANSKLSKELSKIGAACPDHLIHTKRVPLFVDWHPDDGVEILKEKLAEGVETYKSEYQEYFNTYSNSEDVIRDPYPRIVLIPGLGMITAGENAMQAEISQQLYHRAIKVIEGSQVLNGFISLDEEEAFKIEYWPLELYKLSLRPARAEFDGKVMLITGAASGIGRATALQLAREGAHVAILDLNLEGAQKVADQIIQEYGHKKAIALKCDVGEEDAVAEAFRKTILYYGGIDIVVSNAGIGLTHSIEETELKDWNLIQKVLSTGYFLVSREAFRIWRQQNLGGNLIFVGSKNSVRAGKNVIAYSAAKAAELHMARCLAEEGGEAGIRVNTVLPDAVLQGASIFTEEFRKGRAASYGIDPSQLEEYYIQRCILKIPVYPEHIAEAIAFLASSRSSRTTGGVITVDGGVNTAYMR